MHSPRPDLRPEARFAPKQDVSSDASAGASWGMVFQLGQDVGRDGNAWTIHRNRPQSALSPWNVDCKFVFMLRNTNCRDPKNSKVYVLFIITNRLPSQRLASHFLASPRFWNSGSGSWQKGVVLECGTRATSRAFAVFGSELHGVSKKHVKIARNNKLFCKCLGT